MFENDIKMNGPMSKTIDGNYTQPIWYLEKKIQNSI